MILASAIDISINLLMVVHVVISFMLILVVLMQRPKQEGLGAAFGGGVMDSFAGAGTTNFLQKSTVYMGSLFIILSLALAILIGNRNHQRGMEPTPAPEVSAESAPAVPELPEASLMEELEVPETAPAETVPAEGTPAEAETAPAETVIPAQPEIPTEVRDVVSDVVDPTPETSPELETEPAAPQ